MTTPLPTPRFKGPIAAQHVTLLFDLQFLGGAVYEGTYYDLWYAVSVVRPDGDAMATVYAVHSERPADRESYTRWVSAPAGIVETHASYPYLTSWRPGANLALDEADRRAALLELPSRR